MKESYIIAGVLVGTVALVAGGAVLSERLDASAQIEQTAEARVMVDRQSHSWGDIPINNGTVEATFTITNEGSSPLKLFNVSTSCMCTTARLDVAGKKSPAIGMHDESRYVAEVPSGGAATLTVVFDPAFHGPQGVGAINRQVRMQTNDASTPELIFTLDGTVI